MPTWLHTPDVYASLAEGPPGPARDWGTTRLALAAPERFVTLPDDERCHDVLLAAGPPNVTDAVIDALRSRRPAPAGLANCASAVGMYGLLPAEPSAWAEALRGALRGDGAESDVWIAYALAQIGVCDATTLGAAARAEGAHAEWVLPVVVLRVAEAMGELTAAAREVAAELRRTYDRDPHRLLAILTALGVPIGPLAMRYESVEEALDMGARFAGAEPSPVRLPPGSQKRRQQAAVRAVLDGVAGPAAALLREVYTQEPRHEWGLWPVAIAGWLRGRAAPRAAVDVVRDVIFHGVGSDPASLSAARRAVRPEHAADLRRALHEHAEVSDAVLAVTLVRRGHDDGLADAVLHAHGGNADADVRTAALAVVAGFHRPDALPPLIRSDDRGRKLLGLVCAEWVPTQEVLEALLETPVPADARLAAQYARCLAAMADPAIVPVLEPLVAADEEGRFAEARALAEQVLGVGIGR